MNAIARLLQPRSVAVIGASADATKTLGEAAVTARFLDKFAVCGVLTLSKGFVLFLPAAKA